MVLIHFAYREQTSLVRRKSLAWYEFEVELTKGAQNLHTCYHVFKVNLINLSALHFAYRSHFLLKVDVIISTGGIYTQTLPGNGIRS